MISKDSLTTLNFNKLVHQEDFELWYEIKSKSFVFFDKNNNKEELNLIDGDKEQNDSFLKSHNLLVEKNSEERIQELEKEVKSLQGWIDEILPEEPKHPVGWVSAPDGSIGNNPTMVHSSQIYKHPPRKYW